MHTLSESERRQALVLAGFNVFRLSAHAVTYDCFSDVPHHNAIPDTGSADGDADPDEIATALAPLTADASLAFVTKGRAAEIALAEALDLKAPVVVHAGLFATTQAALARIGASLEELPLARDGSADIDLDQLGARLSKGNVSVVYLELANNGWFGWPLSEANVTAVRELCNRHGAKLVLDAARALTNSAGLGAADLLAPAQRILALADAFTIPAAKEFLVPYGAIVGSRDAELIGRVAQIAFKYGTSMSPIDPPAQRAELRDGARYSLAHLEIFADRLGRVRALATRLAAQGIAPIEPVTAHAVYIPIDKSLVPPGDIVSMVSFFGHIYLTSGVRGQLANTKRGPAIRLALQLLHERADDASLDAIASGVATAITTAAEGPKLQVSDGQAATHPYFRRLRLA
jgi:tryptophanase